MWRSTMPPTCHLRSFPSLRLAASSVIISRPSAKMFTTRSAAFIGWASGSIFRLKGRSSAHLDQDHAARDQNRPQGFAREIPCRQIFATKFGKKEGEQNAES